MRFICYECLTPYKDTGGAEGDTVGICSPCAVAALGERLYQECVDRAERAHLRWVGAGTPRTLH